MPGCSPLVTFVAEKKLTIVGTRWRLVAGGWTYSAVAGLSRITIINMHTRDDSTIVIIANTPRPRRPWQRWFRLLAEGHQDDAEGDLPPSSVLGNLDRVHEVEAELVVTARRTLPAPRASRSVRAIETWPVIPHNETRSPNLPW